MSLSIASLKSEVLIAAQRVLNEQSQRFPLFDHFPRRSYDGEELEIRIRRVDNKVGKFTSADGRAYLVRPGSLDRVYVKPLYTRPMHRLSNADLNLFRRWDQVIMSGGGEDGNEVAIAGGQRLAEIVEDTSLEGRETIHNMLAGALQGSFEYEIDGLDVTVDYGHNDCSDSLIGTNWTDAGAPIVTDMYQCLDAYIAYAGVPADTAYYNPKAWARYFAGNTEFRAFVSADPQLARAFAGIRQGLSVVDEELQFIDPFWGLMWIPVAGPHINAAGSSEDRWAVSTITLTTERYDSKRVLELAMARDSYNPAPTWNWETFEQDEPKGTFARYADNGAAAVLIPERVQTIDCEPI